MFEKVNPSHPDKVADRIAGALVDLAYTKSQNPKIAVEVLIGHGHCTVILETSEKIGRQRIEEIVDRIAGPTSLTVVAVPQDPNLAKNQDGKIRCGDNGIFRGCPSTEEQVKLGGLARNLYIKYPSDGKYLIDSQESKIVICQSCNPGIPEDIFRKNVEEIVGEWARPEHLIINPLGQWEGGTNVDSGATNRKLGSDMGDAVTGGGLHGKDLSKADVALNIYCHLKAQELRKPFELSCAIGDERVDGKSYSEIVEIARAYIESVGGFEKFAEWGLV